MNIGIPRESRQDEYRVGLTPAGVEVLTAAGHTCLVERDAGRGAGFADLDYQRAGARIVYSPEEACGRSDLLLKVGRPTAGEVDMLRDGCTVMGFMHLAVSQKERIQKMLEKRVTVIAYETIQNEDGSLPVLSPLSQAAGRMVPEIAASLLQNHRGGKGVLLGGVPGVGNGAGVPLLYRGAYRAAVGGFSAGGVGVGEVEPRVQVLEYPSAQDGRI